MMKTKIKVILIRVILLTAIALAAVVANARPATPEQIITIVEAAQRYHIDPDLALSIAEVESKFNEQAVGSLGELGLFQLRPEFFGADASAPNIRHVDRALHYLAHLRKLRAGDHGDAWFVYFNAGPYRKLKDPKATTYYRRVKAIYNGRKQTRSVADVR